MKRTDGKMYIWKQLKHYNLKHKQKIKKKDLEIYYKWQLFLMMSLWHLHVSFNHWDIRVDWSIRESREILEEQKDKCYI